MLLLNHTCTISRNSALGTNGRKLMEVLYSGVPCLCLPIGANVTIQNDMQLGHAYEVHMAVDTDVRVGDQLACNGMTLTVSHIRKYVGVPPVDHQELMCQEGA